MQKKFFSIIFLIVFLCYGCTQNNSVPPPVISTDSTEQQTFFPVTEYIRGQLHELDSMPITPLKIISHNGKSDSMWMKKEDIKTFAQPFLQPVIDSANLKSLFSVKSFLDQTINAFTFSYDPITILPDTLQLKRWDVYIEPKKNVITRIYLVKEFKKDGALQTQQLTWKSNKWCKITTITEQSGKQPDVTEELMKWDFSE